MIGMIIGTRKRPDLKYHTFGRTPRNEAKYPLIQNRLSRNLVRIESTLPENAVKNVASFFYNKPDSIDSFTKKYSRYAALINRPMIQKGRAFELAKIAPDLPSEIIHHIGLFLYNKTAASEFVYRYEWCNKWLNEDPLVPNYVESNSLSWDDPPKLLDVPAINESSQPIQSIPRKTI